MSNGVVYWKYLPGMKKETDGYIGISKHFEERMKQHHRDAFVRNSIYTVHEQMRTHGDSIITDIIFEGPINECYDLEEQLRPTWHLGWNMAIGGGRPGSGWKPGRDWLCNRLWHPTHGEEVLSKNFTSGDWAAKYNEPNGTNICKVLTGRIYRLKQWTLADAQLSYKIKEKLHQPWSTIYLRNDNIVVKIIRSGNMQFHKAYRMNSKVGVPRILQRGSQKRLYNWELATEKEWLATKERLEFK